jgi:hypothetical protein
MVSKEKTLQSKTFPEIRTRKIDEKMGCQAEKHNPFCPCLTCQKPPENCEKCSNLTKQHIIPRCIARNILGWTEVELDDQSNIEKLSSPCHVDADRKVMKQFERFQQEAKKGKKFTVKDVLLFRGLSPQ